MRSKFIGCLFIMVVLLYKTEITEAQIQKTDTTHEKWRKNVVRYNLSGGILFGIDKYVVLGYERVVGRHQSFSVNLGVAALPKFVHLSTDSFELSRDLKNSGFNFSGDYRFYLAKENKYPPPHGLYIGPFYSFNHFHRENTWTYERGSNNAQLVATKTDMTINTIGGELGYQFVLWKRFAIDLVLIGPGLGFYSIKAEIESTLSEANKEQLQQALTQLITQKFPGFNYVLSGKTLNGNGRLNTSSIGYRYIVHIGFVF